MIAISNNKCNGKKENELFVNGYRCIAKFNGRFPEDKIRFQSENYVLVLDGIVLNKQEIIKNDELYTETIINLYQKYGEQFFKHLRGSFVGALYDKIKDVWIVFRDQLGSRSVYYSTNSGLIVSTDIEWLYYEMKHNNMDLHLDKNGIQTLFDFGITIDGLTICKEVRRVHPGCYLVYENGKLSEKQFYEIRRNEVEYDSEDEYLDLIDEAYKEAVKRQFGKDDENGYKTITCLSGGVDSRMMVWISHQLGWQRQLNITFSNSGWYDETIARQIAKDLHHEWLFKPLDDAQFLYDVDKASCITGGNSSFIGVLHMRSLTGLINFEGAHLGSLHTGSQGEVFKGEAVASGLVNKGGNRYAQYLKDIGIESIIDYSDAEVATIINKYLFIAQGESLSPLLELDFFEKILSIPAKLRKDEYIYKQWIKKRYPDANKYDWATTGLPYGSKRFNPVLPIAHCHLHQLPKYLKYKLGYGGYGMNPWNQFYNSDKGIKVHYDNYEKYLEAIDDNELKMKVKSYFTSSTLSRRFKAITILSAVKLFFS